MCLKINRNVLRAMALALMIGSLFFCMWLTPSVQAEEPDLPTIQRWVNNAAQDADGGSVRDTWAVDNTGVSDGKYVFVDQMGNELFRVKNYPEDYSNGVYVTIPLHEANIALITPEKIDSEIVITLENNSVVYDVSFTAENAYKNTGEFYPGQYKIINVEVTGDLDGVYQLSGVDNVAMTGGESTSVTWELQKVSTASPGNNNESENSETTGAEKGETTGVTNTGEQEDNGVDVVGIINSFDTNGDLLPDTIKLLVAVVILFVVYGVIKYRRKKLEEIHK